MNEKQARFESRKVDLKIAESKLADAQTRLAEGFKKAHAECDEKIALLRREVDRANLDVERERVWLEEAKEAAEQGFES
jgi:hypothetical protein